MNTMSNGRPTKLEQIMMQRTIRQCFVRGFSGRYTAEKTGIDKKTVGKYFGQWSEEIKNSTDKDFLEKYRLERERAILSYENLFSENYESLEEIKDEFEKHKKEKKPIPRYLWSIRNEILRNIAIIIEKKSSLAMTPTSDKSFNRLSKEVMQNVNHK